MMAGVQSDIEGTLWKWTNYFTGWQSRWFVLEGGILSYYKSQDDVINGCKGSIKMNVCDVNVHTTDNTRLDLIIPGEAHFYVKAATPQERQQWLVALGTSKAGLPTHTSLPNHIAGEDELRSKKSELRLYCDLLMQQVHSVKQAVKDKNTPDIQSLNEASSLLGVTCDTFIDTLEDCMLLLNVGGHMTTSIPVTPTSPNSMEANRMMTAIPENSPSRKNLNKNSASPWQPLQRSSSSERYIPQMRSTRSKSNRSTSRSRTASESSSDISGNSLTERSNSVVGEFSSSTGDVNTTGVQQAASVNGTTYHSDTNPGIHEKLHSLPVETEPQISTSFTTMPTSFMDIRLQEDGGIPVAPFLDACRSVLIIFDKLSPTAFIPVKLDISGNIRKIEQKYSTDPVRFETLQSMVLYEIEHDQHHLSECVTIALLWLKRSVEFIREFLYEFSLGRSDLSMCAGNAYGRTLRRYHGMVVRGAFALAQKAIPYREDFITYLATNPEDAKNKANFEQIVIEQTENYISAQDEFIRILNDFYVSHCLEIQEPL